MRSISMAQAYAQAHKMEMFPPVTLLHMDQLPKNLDFIIIIIYFHLRPENIQMKHFPVCVLQFTVYVESSAGGT